MKKLISAIAVAFLLTLGLVALSDAPATAACPYSACVNTTTTVAVPHRIKSGKPVPIRVTVTAPGNVQPTGTVTVTVTHKGRVKYTASQPYTGTPVTFTMPAPRHGHYKVVATYTPTPNSVWNGSRGKNSFNVTKRGHHH